MLDVVGGALVTNHSLDVLEIFILMLATARCTFWVLSLLYRLKREGQW